MAAKGNHDADAEATTITTVQKQNPFQQMIRAMAMDATTAAADDSFTGDDVNLTAILTAETDEELWDADERGPLNFQHLAGCEIGIIDVQVKLSRGNSNPGAGEEIKTIFITPERKQMYLLLTCVRLAVTGDENKTINLPAVGEVFQANTSARYLVAKIWAFYTRGKIDPAMNMMLECRVRATDLGDGQAVLKLRPVVKRPTVTA